MRFETYVFNHCLCCEHFDAENTHGMDVCCKKQNGEPVLNYQVRICKSKKLYEEKKV